MQSLLNLNNLNICYYENSKIIHSKKNLCNCTIISFQHNYNKTITNLPKSTIKIIFNVLFNKILDPEISNNYYSLPNSVLEIIFGNKFNQSVNCLPNLILILKFGNNFNQSVNNLPNTLETIIFGYNFNQSVIMLPNSIIKIEFGNSFFNSIVNLPNSINYLIFYNEDLYYYDDCDNKPYNLQSFIELRINNKLINKFINNLPKILKYLKIHNSIRMAHNNIFEITYPIVVINNLISYKRILNM